MEMSYLQYVVQYVKLLLGDGEKLGRAAMVLLQSALGDLVVIEVGSVEMVFLIVASLKAVDPFSKWTQNMKTASISESSKPGRWFCHPSTFSW